MPESYFALPSNASYSAAKRKLPRWGQWLTANAQMSNAMFGATITQYLKSR